MTKTKSQIQPMNFEDKLSQHSRDPINKSGTIENNNNNNHGVSRLQDSPGRKNESLEDSLLHSPMCHYDEGLKWRDASPSKRLNI